MDLPPGLPQAPAEVHLFGVHEEGRIEAGDLVEGLPAQGQGGPHDHGTTRGRS